MSIQDTLKERASAHGDFSNVSTISQMMKTSLNVASGWNSYNCTSEMREALDMICMKMARIVCGNSSHADHWHDISGYATLIENILITEAGKQ